MHPKNISQSLAVHGLGSK